MRLSLGDPLRLTLGGRRITMAILELRPLQDRMHRDPVGLVSRPHPDLLSCKGHALEPGLKDPEVFVIFKTFQNDK